MLSRWAVVVIDENGEVTVIGAYRWRWCADLMARATTKVLKRAVLNEALGQRFAVDVEHAGPRELARAYGFVQRTRRPL